MNNNLSIQKCKPFLRWAGGKTWLVRKIDDFLPDSFDIYHEPFVGGGSMFFYLEPEASLISDLNEELILTYQVLRDEPDKLVKKLLSYENTKDFYYNMRAKKMRSDLGKAARFLYLNRTSFNGIYRVNLKGEYNVPYGYLKRYNIDVENLYLASDLLQNTDIKCQDFEKSLEDVQREDFVFLDPPYTVTHNNNGFIKYNAKLFDEDSQIRLSNYMDSLNEIGAKYIITNAAHDWVYDEFKRKNNQIFVLDRASLIGGKNAKRGYYEEYLITNI